MNRETQAHFSNLPDIEIRRSRFKRPHTHKTTMSAGDIVPIYVDSDILPGDTVSIDMGSLLRMQTPIFPVMDNAFCDIYFFFVPHRLVWTHWQEFWGENKLTAWEQQTEYTIPQIEAPENGWTKGTLADYMGIPTGVDNISINHLPFRSYAKIFNDWFRDENLKDPCMITMDETTVTGTNSGDYVTNTECGAKPCKAAKFHDYFTSGLPSPQKGPSVTLPLGTSAPVRTGAIQTQQGGTPLSWGWVNPTKAFTPDANTLYPVQMNTITNNTDGTKTHPAEVVDNKTSATNSMRVYPNNLYADLSAATAATINQLRQAFAIQAFYEAQSRGGSRYIEFIKNIFGVTSPDARLQRAEYLGGTRFQINMDQVLQTSATDAVSPQGNTAAFSCTVSTDKIFTHSFVEHGTLMGVAVIRTDHTYQQGIERMWSRKKWTDFYIPQFANLGEMAILNKEIYAQGTSADDEVFAYQEAWGDYRYKPDRISGEMRSNYAQSLDFMHYADDYAALPTLSGTWIDETAKNIDRTISVQSTTADQFFADFYFDTVYVRPMPIYSIPAMLNHF